MKKLCLSCGEVFETTGPNHKRCQACNKSYWKDYMKRYGREYAIRTGVIKNPGVGSGGTTGSGEDNPNWKNGLGRLQNGLGREIKRKRRYCEACKKDLLDATHYQWVIHHVDHNQTHNNETNLMLLCKRCHQIHHKCWKAFERATTISQESRTQESSEAPCPVNTGDDIVCATGKLVED